MSNEIRVRNFHEAKWDEPIILEMSTPGERGIILQADPQITKIVGSAAEILPDSIKRKNAPNLPELAQPQVLRHFLRLSQETLGQELNIDIGLGTCTMKYSPKINEQFVRSEKFAELHPEQDPSTVQGCLEIIYGMQQIMKAISGMDAFSFQPGGGAQAVYSNASILKRYFKDKGEGDTRTEIITTILSHPVNAASPHTVGYKVITLMPEPETGYPSVESLKAVVSEQTAGLFITNPEDTGIFNPNIKEMIDIVHEVGGLCVADIADSNGLYGISRAKEAGFDLCHFNLHKSFSSPHGSMGPCCGAQGAREYLEKYLPNPRIEYDGEKYFWKEDDENSIGKVRKYYGVIATVLRAYSWVLALGPKGLKEVSEVSILNNNYLMKKMLSDVKGISAPWGKEKYRMEQVRYSFEQMKEETGVGTDDIDRRVVDYGLQGFFQSHHPWLIPEPFTPEPNETYSKKDIDEYVAIFQRISEEAYSDPKLVIDAPHRAPISKIDVNPYEKPEDIIVSWRVYKKKKGLK
ncbi:MAG: aminomethyl-transferring glycine dehydrogenase subunit GcvPB [Tissierellia bacterium]|nr:aminomethyl-transferring glycine dehydrogenase subunit GcvPB [Tissierellia bacterium]